GAKSLSIVLAPSRFGGNQIRWLTFRMRGGPNPFPSSEAADMRRPQDNLEACWPLKKIAPADAPTKDVKRDARANLDRFSKFFTGTSASRSVACRTSLPIKTRNMHTLRSSHYSLDWLCGEITASGVTALLTALPPLKVTDVFADIRSSIGNEVAQVAAETSVGMSIEIEIQKQFAVLSKTTIAQATPKHSRVRKVVVHKGDIRNINKATCAALRSSTIAFANNLVFAPSTSDALDAFVTDAPRLVHIITMSKLCWRHRNGCTRRTCCTVLANFVGSFQQAFHGYPSFTTRTGTRKRLHDISYIINILFWHPTPNANVNILSHTNAAAVRI
ncbi:Histone methylation protein DOT1, partial [Phytophthora infestans]